MLKKINPNEKLKLVATSDPAIDHDKSPKIVQKDHESKPMKDKDGKPLMVLKYTQSLNAERDLVFIEGQKPTYFICREIRNAEKAEILDDHNKFDSASRKVSIEKMHSMNMRVFNLCVTEIEENGVKATVNSEEIPLDAIQEIGSFLLFRSSLSDDEKNG